ncbi:Uncharacterised protein [Mycolicibacterium smegmatis]|nr:Uncharacterised protein [Mycolicibacterium smegmatis]
MELPDAPDGFHWVVVGVPTQPWVWVHDFVAHSTKRKVLWSYRVLVATAGDAWAYIDED